ncbi:FHA domain-containing protein [Pirellulaceae bacterium SH467]
MRVAITVTSGPSAGQRFVLRSGQLASVGRSDWNDFAIPEDDRMDESPFVIRCEPHAGILVVRSASSSPLLNGNPLPNPCEHLLHDRDRLSIGRTEFLFAVEGASAPITAIGTVENQTALAAFDAEHWAERVTYLEIEEDPTELVSDGSQGEAIEQKLIRASRWSDCLRWKGFHSDRRELIAWAGALIEPHLDSPQRPIERDAWTACRNWIKQPNDADRMRALELAKKLKWAGPVAALASAIGWSEGSLGPADGEPIPPDPRLTSRLIAIAIEQLARRHHTSAPNGVLQTWIKSMPTTNYLLPGSKTQE